MGRMAVTGCVTEAGSTPGVTDVIPAARGVEVIDAMDFLRQTGVTARTQLRCQVCGFSEICTDEVVDRGVVFLAECPHCEHRWTSLEPIAVADVPEIAPAPARYQRVTARVAREDRPAA
jgi:hypothetical protein